MAQLPEIFYAVEEDLATQYTEDELTDQGNLYVVYRALNGRVWSPELEAGLTQAQKAYLLGLAKGGHIEVSIVRRDCELNEVSIPLEFKNAVAFSPCQIHVHLDHWCRLGCVRGSPCEGQLCRHQPARFLQIG